MGQARQRGTFEERLAMAEELSKEQAEKRRLINIERERNMTPEQRVERINSRVLLSLLAANTLYYKI